MQTKRHIIPAIVVVLLAAMIATGLAVGPVAADAPFGTEADPVDWPPDGAEPTGTNVTDASNVSFEQIDVDERTEQLDPADVDSPGESMPAFEPEDGNASTPSAVTPDDHGDNSWSQFGYDGSKIGLNPTSPAPVENPELDWGFQGEAPSDFASPVVDDDLVIYGNLGGIVYALDSSTGEVVWATQVSGGVFTAPAISNDVVYIGDDAGILYAIDQNSGEVLWGVDTGGPVVSPAINDGSLYAMNFAGIIFEADPTTGDPVWISEMSSPTVGYGVTATDDGVYAGDEFSVAGFDADTGDPKWRLETGNQFYSVPAAADGTVYAVPQDDSTLYALDAETGDTDWAVGAPQSFASPVVTDDSVTLAGLSGDVASFDRNTAELNWVNSDFQGMVASPAGGGDGTLTVADVEGQVGVIDIESGQTYWGAATDGIPFAGSPTLVDGQSVFLNAEGISYAVSGDTGGTPDGTVLYVSAEDGAPGDEVTAVAGIENADDVAGYETAFAYDPSVVEFTGVEGIDLPDPAVNVDEEQGVVVITSSDASGQADPLLAALYFEVIGEPEQVSPVDPIPEATAVVNSSGEQIAVDGYAGDGIGVTERQDFVSVDNVNLSFEDRVAQGESIEGTAALTNNANTTQETNVTFELGNQVVFEETVALDSGEQTTIEIDGTVSEDVEPGPTEWTIATDEDAVGGEVLIVELGDVDVDGNVGPADSVKIQRSIVGLEIEGTFYEPAGDMDGDGAITANDVVLVQRKTVGLPVGVQQQSLVLAR